MCYTLSGGMADVGVPQVLALWQAAGAVRAADRLREHREPAARARGASASAKMAIRLALGSSRGRIVRESLLESAILVTRRNAVLAGGGVGEPAADARLHAGAHRAVRRRLGPDGARRVDDRRDAGVPAAAAAWPSARSRRCTCRAGIVADALKADGRTGAGPARQRMRRALVVAEIALALPLLVAAMLQHLDDHAFPDRLAGLRSEPTC